MPSIFNTVSMVNGKLVQFDDMLIKYGSTDDKPTPTPTPVDPLNPLGLPPFTIRAKFQSGKTPTIGDSQTLVDATENVWDIYKNSTDWSELFARNYIIEVLGANTSGVTNMSYTFDRQSYLTSVALFDTSSVTSMSYMFSQCSMLRTIPLFDTSSVTSMSYMFVACNYVESGALALYQQASTQATPPTYHLKTFTDCGLRTDTGAAELSQIPSSWGGTAA